MKEEKLLVVKEIVSKYTQVPVDNISETTNLGKSAFKGSIIIHRMYAELEKNGIVVTKYHLIDTFGNLLKAISGELNDINGSVNLQVPLVIHTNSSRNNRNSSIQGIGIDIEHINNLPDAQDFRTDSFYASHFSIEEIAHCIASNDPKLSFAGIFAAKEAIFKCSNIEDMRKITIQFDTKGKPSCDGFLISISHSNGFAIANALKIN
jgi:phosphopantetheine--protein transferase-like protein